MLLATVMCTAMLTGCGSDSAANESSQASGSSVAETAAATTTEAAATTEAADKTEGGVLVFGTNAEFPPFEYVGDDGEPDGFDVALIKAVGEKLGMEVQVENMEFDSLVSSIGNRIDGADFGFEAEEYAIALPKGSELVEQVNQALADLKADGTFDALVAEYIGE